MQSLIRGFLGLILSGILATSFSASMVIAGGRVNCVSQYGGGEVCQTVQLQVTKNIWNPDSRQFVHNLSFNNHHFVSGEEVVFDVKVQNVGDISMDNVMLTDQLPDFLVLKSGNLTESLGSLAPGQTVERTIKATVVGENQMISGTICKVNTATATSGSESDQDMAQLCVEKKILAVPSSGPEMLLYPVLASVGGAGWLVKKFLTK